MVGGGEAYNRDFTVAIILCISGQANTMGLFHAPPFCVKTKDFARLASQ